MDLSKSQTEVMVQFHTKDKKRKEKGRGEIKDSEKSIG